MQAHDRIVIDPAGTRYVTQLFKSLGCAQGLGDTFGAISLPGAQSVGQRRRSTR